MLVALAAIGACRAQPDAPQDNRTGNVPIAANVALPEPPRALEPAPVLQRRDLLLAAIQARSAAATGADDREAQGPLDRQRFEFRIRLGCTIVAPDREAEAEATFNPESRRLNLRVAPGISLENPLVAALAGEGVEAAEGFWVRWPWLLVPSCAGDPSAQPEIGLVQLFTDQEPRTERRDGRPYEAAATLPEAAGPPAPGRWELVLRGRLRQHGDSRVIHCRPPSAGAMPVCLISVKFEQVSVEDVETGEELAQWGRG